MFAFSINDGLWLFRVGRVGEEKSGCSCGGGCCCGWLVGRSVGRWVGLFACLVGWLVVCLFVCLFVCFCLFVCLFVCSIGWLNGWVVLPVLFFVAVHWVAKAGEVHFVAAPLRYSVRRGFLMPYRVCFFVIFCDSKRGHRGVPRLSYGGYFF